MYDHNVKRKSKIENPEGLERLEIMTKSFRSRTKSSMMGFHFMIAGSQCQWEPKIENLEGVEIRNDDKTVQVKDQIFNVGVSF